MTQTVGRLLSFVLLLLAAVFAFQRAQEPEYIGIDFVQFHVTGQYVVHGGDPHVYSDKVRREILERAWQEAQSEGIESKFFHAVNFRHERSWESYSSPFLYAVFGAGAGSSESEAVHSRKSMQDPSSGLSATFSPDAGEKRRSEEYERAVELLLDWMSGFDHHWIHDAWLGVADSGLVDAVGGRDSGLVQSTPNRYECRECGSDSVGNGGCPGGNFE